MKRKPRRIDVEDLEKFIFANSQLSDIEAGPTNDFNNVINSLARYDGKRGPMVLYLDKNYRNKYGRFYYRLYQRM